MLEDRTLLASLSVDSSAYDVAAQHAISSALGQDQPAYHAASGAAGISLVNPANGFTAEVKAGTLQVTVGSDIWDMSLEGIGYGGAVEPVGCGRVAADGNRVDDVFAAADEWFVNGPVGLEQGFDVPPPAAGSSGSVTVELALGGDLSAAVNANGDGLTLTRPDGSTALGYTGLEARDATGRSLPASMSVQTEGGHQTLLIHVDAAGARGTITIDPFVQQQKLTANNGAANTGFGTAVAISGNTMVVGTGYDSPFGSLAMGAAYVFTESGFTWSQTQELTAPNGPADLGFGSAVAISGNTIVVGASEAVVGGNNSEGAAYVFTYSGTNWAETQELNPSTSVQFAHFGAAVAISGETMVVGAFGTTVGSNSFQGAAYVFTESGTTWSSETELTAPGGAADDFGDALAIEGGTIVVGASHATIGGTLNRGAAYVFTGSGTSWQGPATLLASDGGEYDYFGTSVGISGTTVAIGADDAEGAVLDQDFGAVYVFNGSALSWNQSQKLHDSNPTPGEGFGASLAISGTTMVVGVFAAGILSPTESETAYVFANSGSSWGQSQILSASDAAAGASFGAVVALNGDTIAVGSPGATIGQNSSQGAVYAFAIPTTVTAVSPGTGPAAGGSSVTITGTGLTGATQVDFGTIPARQFTVDSDGQITATSPVSAAGTVNVRVVMPGGALPVSSNDQYLFVPAPTLTGVSPSAGSLAGGTTVTITGSGFTGATRVAFGLNVASYVVINSDTQITATSPPGTSGTAQITVLTPGGITAISPADQFVYEAAPPAKLVAANGAAGLGFGFTVAISGNMMVVGAPNAAVGSYADQGAAYVYRLAGTAWVQAAELVASDGGAYARFGSSVAIDGGTMVIGADGATIGGNAQQGAAYVFTGSGSSWSQAAKLVASDGAAGDDLGDAVAIAGGTIVVGAEDAAISGKRQQGAAYVFTGAGSSWSRAAKLTGSDGAAEEFFGGSVAIAGGTIVVGATGVSGGGKSFRGAAYVFTGSGSSWRRPPS